MRRLYQAGGAVMDKDFVGMKEMYDINIRLNDPVDIGGRHYDINETVLSFSKADIAQIQESKIYKSATGGYNNKLLVDWEIDKEASFALSHGILSPTSWAILSNSKLNKKGYKSISYREELDVIEDDNFWFVDLKYEPNNIEGKWGLQGNPDNEPMPMGRREWLPLKPLPPQHERFIFCYDAETGKRIMNFEVCGKRIIFKAEHRHVMIDYTFDYVDDIIELNIGDRLFNGSLNLTGKITVKDYFTGEPRTAILEMPQIKLNSSLMMKLGTYYNEPVVSDFYFIAYPPLGQRDVDQRVFNITFLNHELTGEYL